MGILARSLPGNLTIWREILTFEIKKYIRNSGKSDYLAGKNTLFQVVCTSAPVVLCCDLFDHGSRHKTMLANNKQPVSQFVFPVNEN